MELQDGDRSYVAVRFGPMPVVCLRHLGPYSKVDESWAALTAFAADQGLFSPVTCAIGIVYDDPATTKLDRIRYDACLSLSTSVARQKDFVRDGTGLMVRAERIGGEVAWRTVHRGRYETLWEVYEAALSSPRFDEVGLAGPRRPAPYYELYRNWPGIVPDADLLTEVYFPAEAWRP
jgi:AraC family transcriptional regulator